MVNLAVWLKKHRFRLDQDQNLFTVAAGELNHHVLHRKNPLAKIGYKSETSSYRRATNSVVCIKRCCVTTIRQTGR
ncbi:hypothetical protein ACLK1S_18645 [Escherichia coli]